MTSQIVMERHHENIVRDILLELVPQNAVWVFGSRAGGTPKAHSDLDLVLIDFPVISQKTLAELKHRFEESNLPYRVDAMLWSSLDHSFQELIKKHYISF